MENASTLAPFLASAPRDGELIASDRIDRILDAVRNHLGMEIAFVARYVDGDRQFTHLSSDLELPAGPGDREPKEEGFCWHIAEGRLPELIHDAADYPLAQTLPITKMLPVGCHLNVQLRLQDGSLYGSFCALSRSPDRSITQRDMGVLRAFAMLASEAIESDLVNDARQMRFRKTIADLVDGNRLTIMHQPIHALDTGRPAGVECLARFPDASERGPDAWFNEADEVGLGTELEILAVRCALETLRYVPGDHYVSINASPNTIMSGALADVLEESNDPRLVIEVTEHHEVEDFSALAKALRRIKRRARVAIDDVGAGYAGLRHIVELEPDIIKLDMSLTRDVDLNPSRRALAAAMVAFSREIGCSIVAEGIETQPELDVMCDLGVAFGQGYLFSKPLPLVKSMQWMLGEYEEDAPPNPCAEPRRRHA